MTLQTEYEFTLPKGYISKDGTIYQNGTMRLSTAKDEILPLQDPRVVKNEGYLIIILLSRVITRLGDLKNINPGIIENLFSSDLAYLQNFYNQINSNREVKIKCPHCDKEFSQEAVEQQGES